jgi:UDP-glucose:(heptosyl)LPS alpha-1,3-glucosyltransferase
MRVALVILHAEPARGGAECYTIDLAEALARRGHDVSLLASSFAGEITGLRQVRLKCSGITKHGQYLSFLDALDDHLLRQRYDVVHAMLPVRRCDVYHPHAGIAAAMTHPSDRLLRRRRWAMAEVERDLLAGEAGEAGDRPLVLCLSDYVRELIRPIYPLPDKRLPKLFNAVDLERFDARRYVGSDFRRRLRDDPQHDFPVTDDDVLALMVANDFDRKGLRQAIEALAAVEEERLKLLVVGGDDEGAYVNHAAAMGLLDRCLIAGALPAPQEAYAAADFFVLPTRHDPCSLVVLEALAMGLPVISTRFNGACEIMTDGVHGYILDDPEDASALAEAMRKMLDADHRRRMSDACLALRPRLSYEHHLDELLRIYGSIMESGRPTAQEHPSAENEATD